MAASNWRAGGAVLIAAALAAVGPLTARASAAAVSPPVTAGVGSATGPGAEGYVAGLGPLSEVSSQQLDSRLVQITFHTAALTGTTAVRILLPTHYDASGRTRYPVLYLLNGADGDQTSWTIMGDAESATAGYPLIVVMPSGGSDGNYANWFNEGEYGPPMWEAYHIDQLIPWVDAHFPTTGARSGRAIAGLSMGGNGAVHYAARHPDLFTAVGSFSGADDTNNLVEIPVTGSGGLADEGEWGAIFGPYITQQVRWRADNPTDLATNLRGLAITIDTGNGGPDPTHGCYGDGTEQIVYQESLSLHDDLDALGIPHTWDPYGPGCHQWFYWDRDLGWFLPSLMRTFAAPPPPPSPFTFTAAEPVYEAYGWNVAVTRPAMEFSTLADASRAGFTLQGSGHALVTTARLFAPGQRVDVTTSAGAGVMEQVVAADANGRLTVRVALGPGNPYQQDTLQARLWGLGGALGAGFGNVLSESSGTKVYRVDVAFHAVGDHAG